jgi:hypothetical protein
MVVPNMPKDENIIFYDTTTDRPGCSTPESTSNPEPISLNHPTQKFVPYHHPFHINLRNGNHAFRYLHKRRKRQNHGPVLTTRIDYGWIDEWSWDHLTKCLRNSFHCVSSNVQTYNVPLS